MPHAEEHISLLWHYTIMIQKKWRSQTSCKNDNPCFHSSFWHKFALFLKTNILELLKVLSFRKASNFAFCQSLPDYSIFFDKMSNCFKCSKKVWTSEKSLNSEELFSFSCTKDGKEKDCDIIDKKELNF